MRYFAIINGEQQGPYRLDEFPEAGICPDTYVWCKGMTEWRKAEEVGEICRFFRQRLSGTDSEPEGAEMQSDEEETLEDIPLRFRRIVRDSGTPVEKLPDDSEQLPQPMLVEAILVTLFCFPLTGFIAIWSAIKCSRCIKNGDSAGAREYARKRKMWVGITFFLGIIQSAFVMMKSGFL